MIKIQEAFRNQHKAFIAYLMAGDPNLPSSAAYILTAQEAGADLIEIGIPFSDPIAEGEVIQAASQRALRAGTRLDGIFDMVASIKDQMRVPMVFMTYLNPVFVYGYDRFFARCVEIGICGIIIPDMPFEEQDEARQIAKKYGIEVVTLVAPTSASRTAEIARRAEGFLYLVSSMGVTGVRAEITTDLSAIVADIRKETDIPVAIGFGIATPEQARQNAQIADGVIIGSAIVRIIAEHGAHAKQPLYDYIKSIKDAITQL
ncbi:MAG: tryptophan synthase subunit alpha [Oscillospiraceae bacterium]|nr:tryptophan synthase subunit alpha [Oscillospiraceae bacterium]